MSGSTGTTLQGGGTIDIFDLTDVTGAVTFDGGVYNIAIGIESHDNLTLTAINGAVVNIGVGDASYNTLTFNIGSGSTISYTQEFSYGSPITANFSGTGGTLIVPPGAFAQEALPTVNGFGPGDNIGFGVPFLSGDKYVYTATGSGVGTLALENAAGQVLGQVTLNGSYAPGDFAVTDVNGQAELSFACFVPGTLIATPDGEVPVETLRAGDLVLTRANGARPVVAVRQRAFAKAEQFTSDKLRPIHFAAGSLGGGLPRRALRVSPDHSMFLDNVLVPAQLLVNGVTITQPENDQPVSYVHIELLPHDVIFAEGAATESYLDTNGAAYSVMPGVVTLWPREEPKTWEDACAPILLAGPHLTRIRARLLAAVADLDTLAAAA